MGNLTAFTWCIISVNQSLISWVLMTTIENHSYWTWIACICCLCQSGTCLIIPKVWFYVQEKDAWARKLQLACSTFDVYMNVSYRTMYVFLVCHLSFKLKWGEKVHLRETKLTCLVFLSFSAAPLPAILDCCQGNPIRNVSTWLTNDSSHQPPFFLCWIELLYGRMEGGIKREAITFLQHVRAYSHMIHSAHTYICLHPHTHKVTHLYI